MNNAGPPRIVVGLKVAPELAQQLAELARALKSDEVRLVPSSDIHLTLVPPSTRRISPTRVEKLRIAVCGIGRFLLGFEHLRYGPTLRHPHLLWAECVPSGRTRGVAHGALGRIWSDKYAAVPAACHRRAHPKERTGYRPSNPNGSRFVIQPIRHVGRTLPISG